MGAYPRVTSFPPLGQLTTIPAYQEDVCFSVLLEWNRVRPDYSFELFLCHTSSGAAQHPSTWDSTPLEKCQNPSVVKLQDAFRSTFTCSIAKHSLQAYPKRPGFSTISFTVKYRLDPRAAWEWVQTEQGTPPGELVLQMKLDSAIAELSTIIEPTSAWKVEKIKSDVASTSLFHLQTLTSISRGSNEAELQHQVLGSVKEQARYMAVIRLKPYWIGPRQGKGFFYLAEDAVLCSFLTTRGQILTMIAISSLEDNYTVFRSNKDGEIVVAARYDGDDEVPFRILASVASNLEDSIAAVMTEARKMVNESPKMQQLARRVERSAQAVESECRVVEEWLDGLGYCTWNGLGQDLTQEKILKALSKLSENNINISTLLIDDNWQSLAPTLYDFDEPFFRGWDRFEANKKACPNGMKDLISQIRWKYPQIRDIGVWHALMGYWGGLSVDGQIAKSYKTVQADSKLMGNIPCKMLSVAGSDLYRFYDDFYTFLADCGLTFVKTDVQHMLGELTARKDRLELVSNYQSAWTSAYLKHFNGKAISCMSQIPQNLWHSQLQTHTPRIVLRNSDDFYPEIPVSHPWHLWANAHNALLTQHLNVLPDWDMFQTSHEFSEYHAAARCLSGGPVLITDIPGEHDVHLIQKMTALDPNGRSIALRPQVGKTTSGFDEYTAGNLLKIGTQTNSGACLLGLFNISEKGSSCMISLKQFPGLQRDQESQYIVRSYCTGQVFGPFNDISVQQAPSSTDLIYLTVPVRGYDILTAFPVHKIPGKAAGVTWAVLGLVEKMTGSAAVTSIRSQSDEESSCTISSSLKAQGRFAIWIQAPSKSSATVKIMLDAQSSSEITLPSSETTSEVGLVKVEHLSSEDMDSQMASYVVEFNVEKAWEQARSGNQSRSEIQLDVDIQA